MLNPQCDTSFRNDAKVFFKEILCLSEIKQLLISNFHIFNFLDKYVKEENITQ